MRQRRSSRVALRRIYRHPDVFEKMALYREGRAIFTGQGEPE
jgi:hypothetical protein